jgi:hypothetical protein
VHSPWLEDDEGVTDKGVGPVGEGSARGGGGDDDPPQGLIERVGWEL